MIIPEVAQWVLSITIGGFAGWVIAKLFWKFGIEKLLKLHEETAKLEIVADFAEFFHTEIDKHSQEFEQYREGLGLAYTFLLQKGAPEIWASLKKKQTDTVIDVKPEPKK
ncbi:TPA: hypothetical protein ACXEZB_004387 [Escherichia coli]